MISLLEIAERIQVGEKMEEKKWDMEFFNTISGLVKKYDILTPETHCFINTDDDIVERAFEAGIEFLETMGLYCINTRRRIRFSKQEIRSAIRQAPSEIQIGEGKDRRIWKQRNIEEKEQLNVCPGHHAPYSEDLAGLVVSNFAQIPRADFIEGFNFSTVNGREIKGPPMEVYASRRQVAWLREGIRKAGRPGLAVVYYPINTRAEDLICVMDPEHGLRRTDGILLSLLPDLKMEEDLLCAAIVYGEYGSFKLSGSFAIAGGFCGGVEGAIIEAIAKPIAAMMVYGDYINYTGVEHIHMLNAKKILLPWVNWARSIVNQALNRFTHTICMRWIIPTSGPGTELNLLECAMQSIEAPINGMNLYAPRHCRTSTNCGQTPLEAQWIIEVSDAVISQEFDRQGADELLGKIGKQLENKSPADGYSITECYDLIHHRPLPEYRKVYQNVKKILSNVGLNLGA
ncbi:MAG: monomethylamine:corrinoid methyltransferase [Deltaproteobacteria bacterium]|nr:monomethylamine:corrinoid methyltransferase [Deltaproteobacteria bacterium]MBW2153188.1 monomethylamine:corrinoid methyltransferase [Deltaproteobacteria bacterium]